MLGVFVAAALVQTALAAGGYPVPTDTLVMEEFSDILLVSEDQLLSDEEIGKAAALTNFAVGLLRVRDGRGFDADTRRFFLDAVLNDPDAIPPLNLLLAGMSEDERSELILAELLPVAKDKPQAVRLNFLVAKELSRTERTDEADSLLTACLRAAAEPGSPSAEAYTDILVNLLSLRGERQDFDGGRRLVDDSRGKVPEESLLAFNLAAAYFFQDAAENASERPRLWFFASEKERFQELVERHLAAAEEIGLKGKIPPRQLISALQLYGRLELHERAERLILSNLLDDTENPALKSLLATFWESEVGAPHRAYWIWRRFAEAERDESAPNSFYFFKLGKTALDSGFYQQAIEAFETRLLLTPDDVAARYLLGLACFSIQNYAKALKALEPVKKIPEAFHLMGLCFSRLGRYQEAVAAMDEASRLVRAADAAIDLGRPFHIAHAYFNERIGDIAAVEAIIKPLLEVSPEDPELCNFLGYTWADHNINLNRALELISVAVKAEPDSEAYLDSMAWVLFRLGRIDEAREYILKALEQGAPLPHAVISDHAGDIFLKSGDTAEALKYWRLALETYCDEVDRDELRRKIRGNSP